jgi:hypothetical protein
LVRGVLALEQGEAKKVFSALQKGLESLVAQKLVPTSVAKQFRRLRARILEKKEKKMEQQWARVREDGKDPRRMVGRIINCLGDEEGKVVFFAGKQPPRDEVVVLEKIEDRGNFMLCLKWRNQNCNILVFSKGADLHQYLKLERGCSVEGYSSKDPWRKESFLINKVEEILKWLGFAIGNRENKYIFNFESREWAQKFEPSILDRDLFIEEGILWRRDYTWERGDEFRVSGYSRWPTGRREIDPASFLKS